MAYARLRSVWDGMVSVLHAAFSRASGERDLHREEHVEEVEIAVGRSTPARGVLFSSGRASCPIHTPYARPMCRDVEERKAKKYSQFTLVDDGPESTRSVGHEIGSCHFTCRDERRHSSKQPDEHQHTTD